MRCRYQVRNLAGEILSRHRSCLGALDALAKANARAERDGQEQGAVIWDALHDRPAGQDIAAFVEHANLLVRISPQDVGELRRVAAEVGALGQGGRIGTGPSPSALVRGIARREFVVSRPGAGVGEE